MNPASGLDFFYIQRGWFMPLNFSKVFTVQNKKFVTISCKKCGYTELYKAQTSTGMNILDFLIG